MEETVKVITGVDDSGEFETEEKQIKCRLLKTREAEKLVTESLSIHEMKTDKETGEQKLLGEFNQMMDVKGKALDIVIAQSPHKEDIHPEDRTRLFNKYCKKMIDQVMQDQGVIDPK